ncbi:MAG: DUF6443 domain-containing protein [Cyclobacteriaceae bacterium]
MKNILIGLLFIAYSGIAAPGITGASSGCAGSYQYSTFNGPGTTYQWSISGSGSITSSATSYNATVSWWGNGVITVVGTTSSGYTYTLNKTFTIISASWGSVSNTSVCASGSGSVTLTGYDGSINSWQKREKLIHGGWTQWTPISSSSATQNFSNLQYETEFQAYVSNACGNNWSTIGTAYKVIPPSAGNFGYIPIYCGVGNGNIYASNYSGTILNWQKSTDGGNTWTDFANTTPGFYFTNVTVETWYRMVVGNSYCSPVASSGPAKVVVNPTPVGGQTSGDVTICSGTNTTISLTGYTGTIKTWRYKLEFGGYYDLPNTAGLTSITVNVVNGPKSYKAILESGVCAEAESTVSKVTTVDPPQPGTLSVVDNTVCMTNGSADIVLSLSGQSGSLPTWHKSLDGGNTWQVVPPTGSTTSLNYTITQNTQFKSSSHTPYCGTLESNIVGITVDEVAGGMLPAEIDLGNSSGEFQPTLSGHIGNIAQWEKSTDNGNSWSLFSGADIINTSNMAAPIFKTLVPIHVRVKITSSIGICSYKYSTQLFVDFKPALRVGNVTGSSLVTDDVSGNNQISLLLDNFDGQIISWHQSSDVGSTWVAIPNSNSPTLILSDLDEDMWYKAEINDALLGSGFSPIKQIIHQTYVKKDLKNNFVRSTEIITQGVKNAFDLAALDSINKLITYNYYDGLARPVQQVSRNMTPGSKDIVSFATYSSEGRDKKSYLPFTATGVNYYENPQSLQSDFYTNTPAGVTGDAYPFAETIDDASPLNRILEQGAPGAAWQPGSDHTTRYTYQYNAANEVRQWNDSGVSTVSYPARTLYKTEIVDENGNRVITFTNSRGLQILKKVEESAAQFLNTYTIYDMAGRKRYALPPKAVEILGGTGTLDVNNTSISELIYEYRYDSLGRLMERKIPGKTMEYFVYDRLDRLVLTQDGNMRANFQWTFTKWDRENRPVYSGVYTNATQTTRADVQGLLDQLDYTNGDEYYEIPEINASYHGYSNRVFPTTNCELLTVNYYDTYDFDRNGSSDYTYDNSHLAGQENANTLYRGQSTGSKTKILETSNWLTAIVFYDKDTRPIQIQSGNHKNLNLQDKATTIYNEKGQPSKMLNTTHDGTSALDILSQYSYDRVGRLLTISQKNNNDPLQQIAAYSYNELGQLINKDLHVESGGFLQSTDYSYTIRGWLKKVNDPDNINANQLFGMVLLYNETLGGLGQTAAYNGNISAVKWANNSTEVKGYAYSYDKSDRLTSANYGEGTGYLLNAQAYGNTIGYDANGNISSLTRKGPGVASAVDIDVLTYTYDGNKLTKVDDTEGADGFEDQSATTDYTYDDNGNMIGDENKSIDTIYYNILNKPDSIVFASGEAIKYVYNASGSKLTQKHYEGSALTKTTDYLAGKIYENDTLKFFPHPEGRVVVDASGPTPVFEYQYAFTDHLGNVRMLLTAQPDSFIFKATMESETANQMDDALFVNIDETNAVDPDATSYDEVSRLFSTQPVGPGISLPIFPGDTIDMQVKAYHRGGSNFNNSINLTGLITSLASAFGGVNGGSPAEQTAYNAFDNALNAGGFGLQGTGDNTRPAAYLNYMMLDKNLSLVQHGHTQISASGNLETLSLTDVVATKEGWIYVYLTNESNSLNEVYFDDMEVTLKESPVVQQIDYYPFGLQHNTSWTRASDLKNDMLYNAGSELNGQTKNYETFFRQYDPALGRFTAIDPLASSFAGVTPYNYAFNDPIALNDPNGDSPGGRSGSVSQEIHDRNFGMRDPGNHSGANGGYGWSNGLGSGGYTGGYDVSGAPSWEYYNLKHSLKEAANNISGFKHDVTYVDSHGNSMYGDIIVTDYFTNGVKDEAHYINTDYSWSVFGSKFRSLTTNSSWSSYNQTGHDIQGSLLFATFSTTGTLILDGISATTLAGVGLIALAGTVLQGDAVATKIDDRDNRKVYYHYTNATGLLGIMNTAKITPNSKGNVYITDTAMSAANAFQNLFLSNPLYSGKGDFVVSFYLDKNQESQLNYNPMLPFEYVWTNGTLKIDEVLWGGPNPFK